MREQLVCKKCGGPLGKSVHESLCQKCIKSLSLPQCYGCGIICGAEKWGYDAEKEAIPCILKKSGEKIFLCGSCAEKISNNESLIQDRRKIPAEEIEIINGELSQ